VLRRDQEVVHREAGVSAGSVPAGGGDSLLGDAAFAVYDAALRVNARG
jgi:hypothetical protein